MKNEFNKIAKIFALFILGFSFAVVPAANYALSSVEQIDNVIVVFNDRYDDSAITESIETILSTYPKSNVILYESKEFQQISNKYFVQNYIFIGHGSESGVDVNGQILSWEAYGHMASSLHGSYFYFVHCQSDNIANYFPMAKIGLVIPGIIDATLAGQLTSAMIAARNGLKSKVIELISESIETLNLIQEGNKEFSPLFTIDGTHLTDNEIWFSLGELFIIILAIALGEAVLASSGATTGMRALAANKWVHYGEKFLTIFHALLLGVAILELTGVMFEILIDLLGDIGEYLIPYISWLDLLLFGVTAAVTIALIIASGSSYWYVRVAVYGIILGIWAALLLIDADDEDAVWHATVEPPPPPPPGGGGCPILYVKDRKDFMEEGLLDIHDPTGADVFTYHTLKTTPKAKASKFSLRLIEHNLTDSSIDAVRMCAILEDGTLVYLPLTSAIHSSDGDVINELLFSDDMKTRTLGASLNNGISESIDLKFSVEPIQGLKVRNYLFLIEGNNNRIK